MSKTIKSNDSYSSIRSKKTRRRIKRRQHKKERQKSRIFISSALMKFYTSTKQET